MPINDRTVFEEILTGVCQRLTAQARGAEPKIARDSGELEAFVREALTDEYAARGLPINLEPKVQEFPDVVLRPFGIEIKHTKKNTWISIANSIGESHRPAGVERIYVIFGKYGGVPELRWDLYENVVYHARTSHQPRFQINMEARESIFNKLGISYVDFSVLPIKEKMSYMRTYARSRRHLVREFWWLEEDLTPFDDLGPQKRQQVLAEACLLVPELITGCPQSLARAAFYLASVPRVLSYKTAEDFHVHDATAAVGAARGVEGTLALMLDLEAEIEAAAVRVLKGVIEEYWGQTVQPDERLAFFVRRLDALSGNEMKPSAILFGGRFRQGPETRD